HELLAHEGRMARVGMPTYSASSWCSTEKLARPRAPRDDRGVSRTTLLVERVLPIGILAVALIGAPVMIFAPEGLPRMRAVEKELGDVEEDNTQLRRDIESLRGNVARL